MGTSTLFSPLQVGALELKHRVIMAPLTRMRASEPGDAPHAINADYYSQRASDGGLLISEATDITPQARGYRGVPGIYTDAQVEGWSAVTRAVHEKGAFIFNQLWHVGRISHSSFQHGSLPVAPSPVRPMGNHVDANGNAVPFETPRELGRFELPGVAADFVRAAANARLAGFDGIELHAANGYLLDQFLRCGTNIRTDYYGGSVPNRARFLLEVVDGVAATIGADRLGVRLSPWGTFNDMTDSEGSELWCYLAEELERRGIAYLHLVEPRADSRSDVMLPNVDAPDAATHFRPSFHGVLIAAGGFDPKRAQEAVETGYVDAVAFGRSFISNPDLPTRIRLGEPLNRYDRSTFYGGGRHGYTDYPFMNA